LEEGGGVLVAEETEGDEGDDPNFWIGISDGEAKGGDDAWVFDADGRFNHFDAFDAEGICDFGEKDVESASVVEAGEGEGGNDLGGAIF
jgi:hypothetical protein